MASSNTKRKVLLAWASAGFLPGGDDTGFSRWYPRQKHFSWGGPTVLRFDFIKSKLREKHFPTKKLIGNYQISKSRGDQAPCTPCDVHGCLSIGSKLKKNEPYVLFEQSLQFRSVQKPVAIDVCDQQNSCYLSNFSLARHLSDYSIMRITEASTF